jgi:hypothetical protein
MLSAVETLHVTSLQDNHIFIEVQFNRLFTLFSSVIAFDIILSLTGFTFDI